MSYINEHVHKCMWFFFIYIPNCYPTTCLNYSTCGFTTYANVFFMQCSYFMNDVLNYKKNDFNMPYEKTTTLALS